MDFDIPDHLQDFLDRLDDFIEAEITPLQMQDGNNRFFDHRREYARTDWDNDGAPRQEWEDLMVTARRRADDAGFLRFSIPKEYGGQGGGNLEMAIIRDHLAAKGLGLFNDLQSEHSVVGNNIGTLLIVQYGSQAQKDEWIEGLLRSEKHYSYGITEPNHGSDATHMDTSAVRDGRDWIINGEKTWNSLITISSHIMVMARTSGKAGDGDGITAFLVPKDTPGVKVEEMLWSFNMPAEAARLSFENVRVPNSAILGNEGQGLHIVQHFFNENRIRQAASSVGAAQYCVTEAVKYAQDRKPFGKPLAANQGVQFPLVQLQTEIEMARALIQKTAWQMDKYGPFSVSDKVSMCNFFSNRLVCRAADQAMQTHGGLGYSRYKQFEHIYRHHRRYRITEGADEIQMRRVAGYMFGYMKQQAPKGMKVG